MIDITENTTDALEAPLGAEVTAAKTFSGKILPPQQHLLLFDADDWESFIREWAQNQKTLYTKVVRLGGANDHGIDVACFHSKKGFEGDWDNYQCKYYKGSPLAPSTAIPEIGKILWHTFNGNISLPTNYYFFAPKDCGPSLRKLLLAPQKLKAKLIEMWDDWCADNITSLKTIALNGDFLEFVEQVNFECFQYKPTHEVIEEHRKTPFFIPRFGGGLPDRPSSSTPPPHPTAEESRYVEQIYEAYSDREKSGVDAGTLAHFPKLEIHFNRQRESFFHAESLKAFARDTVPSGTFESLQEEIYTGVVDTCEKAHSNGLDRLVAVTGCAAQLALTANGLIQVTRVQDRHGICHQLANDDRLTWVPADE